MNWGWKIFLTIIGFLVFILFMVFKALKQDFHLVADNYYEKEIKYQQEINMIQNARALKHPLRINYHRDEESIQFVYPPSHVKSIKGQLYFYRPSNSKMDKSFDISAEKDGTQRISVKSFAKGLWQIKINWSYGATEYQEEKNIMIQ